MEKGSEMGDQRRADCFSTDKTGEFFKEEEVYMLKHRVKVFGNADKSLYSITSSL